MRAVLVGLTHSNFDLLKSEFVFASFGDLTTRDVNVRERRSDGDDVVSGQFCDTVYVFERCSVDQCQSLSLRPNAL
jgi:hypothetical protein